MGCGEDWAPLTPEAHYLPIVSSLEAGGEFEWSPTFRPLPWHSEGPIVRGSSPLPSSYNIDQGKACTTVPVGEGGTFCAPSEEPFLSLSGSLFFCRDGCVRGGGGKGVSSPFNPNPPARPSLREAGSAAAEGGGGGDSRTGPTSSLDFLLCPSPPLHPSPRKEQEEQDRRQVGKCGTIASLGF